MKRPKKSLKSFNPLARGSIGIKRKNKKLISEQQLGVLRTHCTVSRRFKG
jgi:hypothetical protein